MLWALQLGGAPVQREEMPGTRSWMFAANSADCEVAVYLVKLTGLAPVTPKLHSI